MRVGQQAGEPGLRLRIVGVDEYSAMEAYRRDRAATLNGAWWNTAWLMLAALLATSFYIHAKWKRHQMETIRAAYRLATQEAGEGFFIKRPLRGPHGAVQDFEILDCNLHGADMLGGQPRQIIGRRPSDFYRGKLFDATHALLCEASPAACATARSACRRPRASRLTRSGSATRRYAPAATWRSRSATSASPRRM